MTPPAVRNGDMAEKTPRYIEGVGWRFDYDPARQRPHPTHDYSGIGTYEITLCVEGRYPLFGRMAGTTLRPGDPPRVELTTLGRRIEQECIPSISEHFPMVKVWQHCIMPDHIHMIIRVGQALPSNKPLGTVIGAFKGNVSRIWWRMAETAPEAEDRRLGHQPIFEERFCDRILMRPGQLDNWKAYLRDNPFRQLFRREHPDLMRRALCIEIAGVRYGAFGNFMLLRHPEKVQVFFHRRTGGLPTEQTPFWEAEHARLVDLAKDGAVLVTPGISECEKRIKNEAVERRLRLIHLQKEPVGPHFKPERSRFEACMDGSLLVLAPWAEDLGGGCDYERFHRLNDLAAAICRLGAADAMKVVGR